jgi:hypothetical protein
MSAEEWQRYKVGSLAQGNFQNPSCRTFSEVYHVAHIQDAIRIIEDQQIQASLIQDESKLNHTRTCVSWVSPNTWPDGSIYGNVSFTFEWSALVEGKHLYWVEAMQQYSPHAYRILITDKKNPAVENLTLYDPTTGDGPLLLRDGCWYRNGNYNGEFMIEANLPLEHCREISFIKHHPNICSKEKNCLEKTLYENDAGALLLAYILGRNLKSIKPLLLDKTQVKLSSLTSRLLGWLYNNISLRDYHENNITIDEETSILIMRSALDAYARKDEEKLLVLLSNIGELDNVKGVFYSLASMYFEVDLRISKS